MALENFVIHDITLPEFNLTGYTYHQIMFGAGASAVLNGTTVTVTGPIIINLRLRSVGTPLPAAATVYALGYQMAIETITIT